MKTEKMSNKLPEGFNAYGLPIDKSAPPERVGVRLGLNLTVMIDSPLNQYSAYSSVILWNTETGERMRVQLDIPTTKVPIPISSMTAIPTTKQENQASGGLINVQMPADSSGLTFRG